MKKLPKRKPDSKAKSSFQQTEKCIYGKFFYYDSCTGLLVKVKSATWGFNLKKS